ncbi:hypothetical protein ABFS82_04G009300 [Erythranthe guttata]|uniref:Uncharacterized protein n=1 Tax=Erythranthe guttata TaxID=4155 RepID=A0A022S5U5_ERYGU|nr:PREDICTED: uncharacterized protein LOC105954901 [Erythranthe guttata]EYU46790.1 hypothetical protein MIMGU_mgv1a012088mg [Erythranthe guttata]|eukprot:XP_012834042.1 PREDICTED: uncharacterized protein LOC105954901 [Erythranthe guttata]
MGLESCAAAAASPSSSPSATAKRGRDPEDEVYIDNLNCHKRYLSEVMASSLNGLTVGDSLPENLMHSPVRSENMLPYLREETSSPMSEDSDDSRYYESSTNTCPSQPESGTTSPVSPYRGQKPLISGFTSGGATTSYPPHGSIASSLPRQRSSDTEGRFPSSPSDICHSADLRRTALLRSVQMRSQPLLSSQYELPASLGQESCNNVGVEDRACSYMKVDVDVDEEYEIAESTSLGVSECKDGDKSCGTSVVELKGDESAAE